ncbi:MAG: Asp-tRNA(Asn)/Glu-tRNA(Gln) amidotransferase subunit GatA [bacterium]|nr:Asp-tRNA(Asn)/Glu-tRNA(Gln) amidotransferase subunit GatA [bacterium]
MSDYKSMTAAEIAKAVSSGQLSAVEITKEALELARTEGKELNAFVTLCEEKALKQASELDQIVKDDRAGGSPPLPLCGVPVAIKDNISYTGYKTTCGSHILEGYQPPYDATAVQNLIKAGAVIIGKTNMDEFAMGSSNETSYFGPVKNPVGDDLVPGGSSGGSAAAVAAGIVPIAFGSETGGSVRQPASFCGIQGLKPTYGGISRYGLVAFGSSLDQISPFARNSEDLALAYQAVSVYDPNDSTSLNYERPNYTKALDRDRKFRIGVPKEFFAEGLDAEVEKSIRDGIDRLRAEGHTIEELSLPLIDQSIAAYYTIACAEASSNLARYDGVKYGIREGGDKSLAEMYAETRSVGFGDEVKRRIMLGTFVLSSGYYDAYYQKASQVRELICREFESAFEKHDLLIGPTTPTAAFKFGEKIDDPLAMYLSDMFVASANLTGSPALSIPCGLTSDERPIGLQFVARRQGESELFQIAHAWERLA